MSHETLELSTPFLKDTHTSRAQANALPYHWLELSHLLLTHAADDIDEADTVRRLLRDLREVRMSKLRKGFRVLEGGAGLQINGVGGMEVAEVRGFVVGVVDGLRYVCLVGFVVRWGDLLTLRFTGRSDAREKKHDEKNKRMGLAAVPTQTMMTTTTTCNYNNVHFPFLGFGSRPFCLLFYGYNVMYRVTWRASFEPPACGVWQMLDRKYARFHARRRRTVDSLWFIIPKEKFQSQAYSPRHTS